MTEIRYSMKDFFLECKGHAGGGPEGQDIICAGISSLSMALLNQLIEEEEQEHIRLQWLIEPGYLKIKATALNKKYSMTIKDYFRVIIIGMKALKENYPENIKMEEEQGNGSV